MTTFVKMRLKMCMPDDPAISLLVIYYIGNLSCIQENICNITVSNSKIWNQPSPEN